MAVTIDYQIRKAIKEKLLVAAPQAKVFIWDMLSADPNEWANIFSQWFGAEEQIHGWVIKRSGIKSELIRNRFDKATYFYDLWGFYGFRSGDENDNSDLEFNEIIDNFRAELVKDLKLGLVEVDEHTLAQFKNMTILPSGGEQLQFAPGTLEVKLCC